MQEKTLAPLLQGQRIYLKKHEESLAGQMFAFIEKDRQRLGQFLPWVPIVKSEQDELQYIQRTHKCWDDCTLFDYGLFRKHDDQYMGNIGIHTIFWDYDRCEIGYWILGDFEGQGFMKEAVQVLEKHLFELGFHRVEIRCSSLNQRSANVPRACGYTFEGLHKENSVEHQKYRHTFVFAKLSTEYKKDYVRKMTDMDHESILQIGKDLPAFFTPKGLEYIRTDLYNQQGLVSIKQERTVGFLTYFANQGAAEIGWMAVTPPYQNQGVGKLLLDALIQELKKSGCTSLIVKTLDESVDYKPYDQTRAFYLKNGFEKFKVLQHPDNPDCPAELILQKLI